jgi:hypothetical protein
MRCMAELAAAFAKIILSGETILAASDVEQFYSGHRRILLSHWLLFFDFLQIRF